MRIIKKIQTRRGAKLNINGEAEKIISRTPSSNTFALKPDDFFGTFPKLLKKEGDEVKAGEPVFLQQERASYKVCFSSLWYCT
jgi:Na+-transporting NADH:ubiquinone oxidoreductase subunit A